MTIAREGWPFILPFLLGAVVLLVLGLKPWGILAAVLAVGILLFFRNPRRHFDGPPDAILAAADGLVTSVDRVHDAAVAEGELQRVVTFLSVFDVHVQRAPTTGVVLESVHTPGRKVAAFRPDADQVNENHLTVLRRDDGTVLGVRQIAGLVARRVVAYPEAGDRIERGELIGLIKFGSRVDLLLPAGSRVLVRKGQRLKAGATVVATAVHPS